MASTGSGRTNNAARCAPNSFAAAKAPASTTWSRGVPVSGTRILATDMGDLPQPTTLSLPLRFENAAPTEHVPGGVQHPDDIAKSSTPGRAWQRMLSGRRLDLLDPSPLDIEIEDIAHGLARVARWNGQTTGAHAFSVAQHCVLVERLTAELSPRVAREARLAALLHDAS